MSMVAAYLMSVPVGGHDGGAADVVLVEVDAPAGMVPASRVGDLVVTATETLQDSLRKVRQVGQLVIDQMSSLSRQPAVLKVEFGVKLSGEAGVIITKAGGEANFVLSLEWHAREQNEGVG
jgi:hypothetical protein